VKKTLMMFALAAMTAMAGEWKGTIGDSKCGAKHADASEKSMACAKICVKGGAAAVFITEDGKVLKIDNADKVAEHIGHKVTITGNIDGDSVHIDSVKM
jgi:hypothetical protein